MKLLAIETATEACSAALYLDGEVRERYRLAPREHAALILSMTDQLLLEAGMGVAELDAIAFGRGPGSFTGVRIATGVAQGIAFAADRPVVPVSTLATLAQGAYREWSAGRVLACIDARMGEVYWGGYLVQGGLAVAAGEECVCPPGQVPQPEGEGWFGVGSGWGSYREALAARVGKHLAGSEPGFLPHAQDAALLAVAALNRGEGVAAVDALPVYLRDNVVRSGKR